MKPHIEEAWRSLRLADRDIIAFEIFKQEPAAHISIINFHAQFDFVHFDREPSTRCKCNAWNVLDFMNIAVKPQHS